MKKITNIEHTISCHPDAPDTWRHNFEVKLTNLTDDQAVKFWEFIGELHIDEAVELEPVWSQKTDGEPDLSDDGFDGTN